MQPLKIQARCVVDAEGRLEQIKAACERGLHEFGPSPAHKKEVCVIGSGPSAKGQLKKIRKLHDAGCFILAIKGAHNFLIKNKIIPHAALAVDPQPHIVECFTKKLGKNAGFRPVYLIASQCHAELFDYLEDQEVILWHLLATSSHEWLGNRCQIGGGSTSGSRGIVLAWMMGFRTFHLFGFDSCLQGKGKRPLRKITGERWGGVKEENTLELWCEGKTYYADPAMAAQANEIQDVIKMLEGSRFKAYGKGLIQEIFKANAKKQVGGYYAVNHQFGERAVPPVRKEVSRFAAEALDAARNGVYRGQNYFSGDKKSA